MYISVHECSTCIDPFNVEIVCSCMFEWNVRCFWLSTGCEDLVVVYATAGLNPVYPIENDLDQLCIPFEELGD
jgi:hypothetical protein